MLQFFVDTYEDNIQAQDRHTDAVGDDETSALDDGHPSRGRRRNHRVRYLPSHPLAKTKQRVVRSRGHTNLPNIIGAYFPRRDDPEIRDFYCACMLLLLKPWRNINTDLKLPIESWETAFNSFVNTAPASVTRILSNIQYLHECKTAAKNNPPPAEFSKQWNQEHDEQMDSELHLGKDVHAGPKIGPLLTEEGLEELVASMTSWGEVNHGRHAIHVANQAKIFPSSSTSWHLNPVRKTISNATGDDLQCLLSWKAMMDRDVKLQNEGMSLNNDAMKESSSDGGGSVTRLQEGEESLFDKGDVLHYNYDMQIKSPKESLPPVDPSQLKPAQRRAYDVVLWHLDQTLAGNSPPPLRMILHGEGGTGKSKVIQTITEGFANQGVRYLLLKSAYTGVAASLINGKTTHTIGMVSQLGKITSDKTRKKLQEFWKLYTYLVIDEYSMIGKAFLAKLSRNIGIGKAKGGEENNVGSSQSFGGINVILCGDLHQFPPVAGRKREPLFYPEHYTDTIDAQIGRKIYEEFTTVVILREQVRVTDPEWRDFLRHLRDGCVQERDVHMLRQLLITNPQCLPTDFTQEPWNDQRLVTPRHAVRKEWNDAAVEKHCKETGQQLFICPAQDTIRGRPLSIVERYAVALRGKGDGSRRKRNELPETVQLAVGMKVMVTQNVETDLDITNGARGEIIDIILHPNEPPVGNDAVVTLAYPPSYILVKLDKTRVTQLEGLEPGIIPVEPALRTFMITVQIDGKEVTRTVRRQQYPMTPACSFTDYRAQGQTIPYVLIDIATPPTGGLNLFNLYVALSRSSGRNTIRILRDFDDEVFKKAHVPELLEEDHRLESLDAQTKTWWEVKVQALL